MNKEQFFSDDRDVIALYEGTTGKQYAGIGYRYEKAFAVWLIEYNGVVTVVTQWMSGAYLQWECHGLSQPHHDKGGIKNQLIEKVFGAGIEIRLLGYDIAFYTPLPFHGVLKDIVTPWSFVKALEGQSKERYGFYPHKTGTIYLQPKSLKGTNNSVKVYDKTLKHDLDFDLTRIEITKVLNDKSIISLKYLSALLEIERRTFLGTDELIVRAVLG